MSNKQRIAEIEVELAQMRRRMASPKATHGLREELRVLMEAEATQVAPPVVEAPKPKKTKKTKKS